jgi:type I site-specific restriction endonuclease
MKHARISDWVRTRRYDEPSKDLVRSSLRQSCPDCIIATHGYSFREGQGYDPTPWNGFTDFSLYHPDGTVLAVIEAKRTARNAREGEEQLRQYVKEIAAKQKAPLCVPKTPSVLICRPNRLTLATMVALIFLFLNQRAVWKQRTRRSDIS